MFTGAAWRCPLGPHDPPAGVVRHLYELTDGLNMRFRDCAYRSDE